MREITNRRYRWIERITSWVIFLLATLTYLSTMELSSSVWDCPEFITTFSRMEVGHPPGAPFYMLFYNFFSHLFPSHGQWVAIAANSISATLSGLTVMLLFLSITHLVRRRNQLRAEWNTPHGLTLTEVLLYIGSGAVGALLYAFTDTFWYSAVEAEVYSFSSFFTALVFYLMLQWEEDADAEHSDRWLLLIALLMGLSVGVHLLNLLALPAMALIYYFRKSSAPSWKGGVVSLLVSFGLIIVMMYGMLQGAPEMAGYFDLFFVNILGLPFNSGLLFYVVLLMGLLSFTYYLSIRRPLRAGLFRVTFLLSVVLMGIPFIGSSWWLPCLLIALLGYFLFVKWKVLPVHHLSLCTVGMFLFFVGMSSYGVILLRAASDIPMNQNAPSDAFALRYYLSREQYGSTPLIYGQTYASLPEYGSDGKAVVDRTISYRKVSKQSPDEKDRYERVVNESIRYRSDMKMLFPRMYSNMLPHYKEGYQLWGDVEGRPVTISDRGQARTVIVPTFMENLRYFFGYQVNYMYWRYFLWNFSGRQNDLQGQGEIHKGNWITGIPFIDALFLGPQEDLPSFIVDNKGHNRYFMLPLILGLLGIVAQLFGGRRDKENFWIIFAFFFMTGLAIVLYLNQPPYQVRERDYAYAGSFYAFAIWIGMSVPALYDMLNKSEKDKPWLVGLVTAVGLAVVTLVLTQNYDDHDRSGRRLASDFGRNYLESCEPNAVIFCNGDNDTFPLWYAQDVEGVRQDIKVCNTSYLQADWYIDQMKRNSYEENALPITWTNAVYGGDKRMAAYILPQRRDTLSVRLGLDFIASDDPKTRTIPQVREQIDYLPVEYLKLPYDTEELLKQGSIYPSDTAFTKSGAMLFDFSKKNYLGRHELIILDMMDGNHFERPLYYAITVGEEQRLGMTPHFRQSGMAYQIMPFVVQGTGTEIDTERMYRNVTERFRWGGAEVPGTYFDENSRKLVETYRSAVFAPLASALARAGKKEQAREVLELCERVILEENVPHGVSSLPLVGAYYDVGDTQRAEELSVQLMEQKLDELRWFFSLSPLQLLGSMPEIQNGVVICTELMKYNKASGGSLETKYGTLLKGYQDRFLSLYKLINEND